MQQICWKKKIRGSYNPIREQYNRIQTEYNPKIRVTKPNYPMQLQQYEHNKEKNIRPTEPNRKDSDKDKQIEELRNKVMLLQDMINKAQISTDINTTQGTKVTL